MSTLDEIKKVRHEKIALLEQYGMQPFPARVPRDLSLDDMVHHFDAHLAQGNEQSITGRVMAIRGQGAINFVILQEGNVRFQVVFKKDTLDSALFELFTQAVDIGDTLSVTGTPFVTKRGENSLLVSAWVMASKSLAPLPEKWHGLQDTDERYRKRYLDILMNEELYILFQKKAAFWSEMRSFLTERGFQEVETPTLEVTTGGAEANPFKTHHKDFDLDVYLRISVGELWQKRLLAAGIPQTFEIGRAYRNEGSSPDHLQEFTNMEFYMAYADYRDGMQLVTELYRTLAQRVFGTTSFTTRGHSFDLADTWQEIDYRDEVLRQTGIDIITASSDDMEQKLRELGVTYQGTTRERLIDTLWKYCRKSISGPAFVMHHPKIVSPLSKTTMHNPELTERFQVILAGSEVGNGFSELNDPREQRERFEIQQALIAAGDEEAMMPEWEFVEMLEMVCLPHVVLV
ncbi:MAG: OB-fold nucleic acid binding domain-containing protein [Candidatus Pacebacteria bacterium]|nr:OB-fold nucleic acid binding domain-containing protein [Candidatus Paceibacterota bacterium]